MRGHVGFEILWPKVQCVSMRRFEDQKGFRWILQFKGPDTKMEPFIDSRGDPTHKDTCQEYPLFQASPLTDKMYIGIVHCYGKGSEIAKRAELLEWLENTAAGPLIPEQYRGQKLFSRWDNVDIPELPTLQSLELTGVHIDISGRFPNINFDKHSSVQGITINKDKFFKLKRLYLREILIPDDPIFFLRLYHIFIIAQDYLSFHITIGTYDNEYLDYIFGPGNASVIPLSSTSNAFLHVQEIGPFRVGDRDHIHVLDKITISRCVIINPTFLRPSEQLSREIQGLALAKGRETYNLHPSPG